MGGTTVLVGNTRRAAKRAARRKANELATRGPVLHYGSNFPASAAQERHLAMVQTVNAKPVPAMNQPSVGRRRRARGRKTRRAKAGPTPAASGLHPHVSEYLSQLNSPNEYGHGKVPLNPMGVPTNNSLTFKSYNTFTSSPSPATATEIGFFPGHNYSDAADPVDLVSAHAYTQTINGTALIIGPAGDGVRGNCIGYQVSGGANDTFYAATNVATASALGAAENAPFTVSDQNGNHTRWRLQSLQVTIENVTAISSIGGDVVVVQPDHKEQSTAVGAYVKYSSFRRYNSTTPIVVKWVPRSEDLYWWHSDSGTAAIGTLGVGIRILLNNTSTTSQSYRISWVANWEIAGAQYAALSTPTLDSAQGQMVVPRAINAARNHSGTTQHLLAHGEVEAAAADSGIAKGLSRRLSTMYKAVPSAVKDHVARALGDGFLGRAAGVIGGALAAVAP